MGNTSHKHIILAFFALSFLLLPILSFAGPKTDTVYLYNGDRITGEVKRFEYGVLFFKTDGMGTLNIEYDRIKTFYSTQQFTIQTASGLRFFGSIDTSHTDGSVNLRVKSFYISEPISDIVEIYPVKNAFWKRLDGHVDIGYSYTKASTISQFNFSGNVSHRVQKSFTDINGSTILTDQEDRDRIRKQDYSLSFSRFFKNGWFATSFVGAQQNTELGTDHRYYGGLGVGNDLVHNNLHALNGALGLMFTTEKATPDTIINSIEGVMQWKYKIFKFNNPDIDVSSNFNVYPSFTSPGRYRLEFSVNAKIEIFNDFFFGLTFYDNYDSKPLDQEAATNDWGVNTSIGYSW
jgi:hypothetical protein